MPTEEARMRALTANAGELAARIDELHKSVDAETKEIAAQNRRNAFKIKALAAVIGLLVVVIVLGGVGYVRLKETSARQAEISARLEASDRRQEIVRSRVLCPMYQVFLGGYQPETRKPGPDRDKYEAAFAEMRKQYAVLNCTGDLVPPRSDVVTKPPR